MNNLDPQLRPYPRNSAEAAARIVALAPIANGRIKAQMDILNRNINNFEQVDPLEAQTRISALETQLDMAFALTSRMQQLSLLNYL